MEVHWRRKFGKKYQKLHFSYFEYGLCSLISWTIWGLETYIIPFLKTSGSVDFKNGIICHNRCQDVWDIAKTANPTFFWDTLYIWVYSRRLGCEFDILTHHVTGQEGDSKISYITEKIVSLLRQYRDQAFAAPYTFSDKIWGWTLAWSYIANEYVPD